MKKLKIRWGIRARRCEKKIRERRDNSWFRKCLEEKEERGWKDRYGKEREKYYNRNSWGICILEALRNGGERDLETELICREREVQKQWEEGKIVETRYNIRYKQLKLAEGESNYLRKEILKKEKRGNYVRALVRLRCDNLEEENKYWKEQKNRISVFCRRGENSMKYYVENCTEIKRWFVELGTNIEKRNRRL